MAKNYDNEDGVWRTIGGRRVFIKSGQSVADAMKESGKFKSAKKNEKKDDNLSQEKIDEAKKKFEKEVENKSEKYKLFVERRDAEAVLSMLNEEGSDFTFGDVKIEDGVLKTDVGVFMPDERGYVTRDLEIPLSENETYSSFEEKMRDWQSNHSTPDSFYDEDFKESDVYDKDRPYLSKEAMKANEKWLDEHPQKDEFDEKEYNKRFKGGADYRHAQEQIDKQSNEKAKEKSSSEDKTYKGKGQNPSLVYSNDRRIDIDSEGNATIWKDGKIEKQMKLPDNVKGDGVKKYFDDTLSKSSGSNEKQYKITGSEYTGGGIDLYGGEVGDYTFIADSEGGIQYFDKKQGMTLDKYLSLENDAYEGKYGKDIGGAYDYEQKYAKFDVVPKDVEKQILKEVSGGKFDTNDISRGAFDNTLSKSTGSQSKFTADEEDILDRYSKDYGYDDKDRIKNLKGQIDYMRYNGESVNHAAQRLVEGGDFLIYNGDVKDYLDERGIKYNDDNFFDKYKEDMGKKIEKLYNQGSETPKSSEATKSVNELMNNSIREKANKKKTSGSGTINVGSKATLSDREVRGVKTQKALKSLSDEGKATDITRLDDKATKALRDKHGRLEAVQVTKGTYGMNGALLRSSKTGEYFVITSRNSNLFYWV